MIMEKVQNQCVYKKKDGKWSFYDENNRPIGIEYDSIENAINALYKYLNIIGKNVQHS